MEIRGRQAECPNCGGPIEWKLGASAAQVCPYCRFTVVRTDRDLKAIGKVADLVPTAPAMAVGDVGQIAGTGFTVYGRQQLDHGKGPWDEFYVSLGERWGWLAKAQGKWYLTFFVEAQGLPTWDQMAPGQAGNLPGGGPEPWTVQERGSSTVVSAEGELPYPIAGGRPGRYVDVVGPNGKFGTIDYGDGSQAPMFFAGQEYPADQVQFRDGGGGPPPTEMVETKRLTCPNCSAPCPVFVPEQTERVSCQSCNGLLDFSQGAFTYLKQLNQPQVVPYIPLGRTGTLKGEEVMCIGFMERGVVVEGTVYTWREYLLHTAKGYRWLLEDSGHFTLVSPTSAADVKILGTKAEFQNKKYKLFQMSKPQVRFVIGEFYWTVEVGETTDAADFIAPPLILSEERTRGEINLSAGGYVTGKEVWSAFKLEGSPPKPYDVAPAQPNPVKLLFPLVFSLITVLLLLAVFFVMKKDVPVQTLMDLPITMPAVAESSMVAQGGQTIATSRSPVATTGPSVNVSYSEPFTMPEGADTVKIMVTSNLGHGWMGVGCSLINQSTGVMTEFNMEQDHFQEVSAAERASGRTAEVTVGNLVPGSYVLRIDPRWARKTGSTGATIPPGANLRVATVDSQDRSGCCCLTLFILFLPVPLSLIRRKLFESRRWRNSNVR